MFDSFSVVSTAVSSFNNAALYNPLFFALGLLMLPLFFIVYLYGGDFVSRIGWQKNEIEQKTGFFSGLFLLVWLLIFGGNYAVIRDGISLLSVMIASVLFVLIVLLVQQSVRLKYIEKISGKKTRWFLFGGLLIFAILSAPHNWVGILLQISAVLCGVMVGCRIKHELPLRDVITVVFGFVTTLILMQPEYFRFGQLGNLTLVHLASVLFVGFCVVTTLTAKYTNARSKIYKSAYIKLKWLFRIVSLLAFVLFISTESVPVFIGLLGSVALLEMLTIYHSAKSFNNVSNVSWALMLIGFGIITICPVISSLGLIYMINKANNLKLADFKDLL